MREAMIAMALILSLFYASSGATEEICERLLAATARFPNAVHVLELGEFKRDSLDSNLQYEKALASLPEGVDAISINYMTGGQMNFPSVEHLVGRTLVGVNLYQQEPGAPREFHFVAGQIGAATVVKDLGYDQLLLKIKTLDGEKEIAIHPHIYAEPTDPQAYQLLILDTKKTKEERIREAFQFVNFPKVIGEIFGEPATAEDFAVALAAVQTYLSLPASWGVPGTVKTLRGQHHKTKAHKNFGIVADNKRYGPKALTAFLTRAENFMKNLGLIEIRALESADSSKENLSLKQPQTSVAVFLDLLAGLQNAQSVLPFIAQPSRLTAVDLTAAAAKQVNLDHINKMLDLLFAGLVKNQKHIRPTWSGETYDKISTNFLGARGTDRKRAYPVTQIKKKKGPAGPLVTYRIDTKKMIQIDIARMWFYMDPVMEVQFKENSTEILSVQYFWNLYISNFGELIPVPALSGESTDINVDFSQFNSWIPKLLEEQNAIYLKARAELERTKK